VAANRRSPDSSTPRRLTSKARHIRRNGFRSRGRIFKPHQIQEIDRLVRKYYDEGRTSISIRVCRSLRWRQPNGDLKDMACREVLRQLHDAEVITLPAPKWGGGRWKSSGVTDNAKVNSNPLTSLNLTEVQIVRVESKRSIYAPTWNALVEQFHYLRSSRIVGRQIKYIAFYDNQPIACLGWGDCAWSQSARDNWIGWTDKQRSRNRHLIVNNCRFLILPWVRVPNLASWLIAKCSNSLVSDWYDQYAIRPVLLETFVDSSLFFGTCYKAANWAEVGLTSGYSKVGSRHHNSQTPKFVFVRPTCADFRTRLRQR
jgi:hypothetical protein